MRNRHRHAIEKASCRWREGAVNFFIYAQANAFFSDPWIRRQPWLELEQGAGAGAANRTADEEILDVALAAQKEGATVLCTRDKNLRLRAAHAGVDALDLVETRSKAHARDVSWRRAYGHLLPSSYDDAARREYLRNY